MTINVIRRDERPSLAGFYTFRVVSDAAGGTEYFKLSGLFRPTTRAGMVMQPRGGAISYSLTLANEDDATNPDPAVQASIPWTVPIVLLNNALTRDPNFLLATAMKLIITGAAELTVAVL
jgi:hypothetical protein